MTGLSARNLKYMRALAEAHPDREFVQQVVARLPWGHVVRLLEMVKDAARREWYVRQTIEHGWSRNVLVHQIESKLYERQGKALTNFSRTLPAPQSDLAQQLINLPGKINRAWLEFFPAVLFVGRRAYWASTAFWIPPFSLCWIAVTACSSASTLVAIVESF
jgi:hypothetical protein